MTTEPDIPNFTFNLLNAISVELRLRNDDKLEVRVCKEWSSRQTILARRVYTWSSLRRHLKEGLRL